jgi:hypothetical protein
MCPLQRGLGVQRVLSVEFQNVYHYFTSTVFIINFGGAVYWVTDFLMRAHFVCVEVTL